MKRLAICVAVSTALIACGSSSSSAPTKNIVQLAQANPNLSILVEAVTAANLATTLSGPGPYTVFAPTNEAFASLFTELGVTEAQLLANTTLLTSVLEYHVLSASVMTSRSRWVRPSPRWTVASSRSTRGVPAW